MLIKCMKYPKNMRSILYPPPIPLEHIPLSYMVHISTRELPPWSSIGFATNTIIANTTLNIVSSITIFNIQTSKSLFSKL